MAVSAALTEAGFVAGNLDTEAILDLDMGALSITGILLNLKADAIEGVSADLFIKIVEGAKDHCIVSKALSVPISLTVIYGGN